MTCQDRKRGRDVPSWRLSAARKGQSWQKGKSQTPLVEHFSAWLFILEETRDKTGFGSLADFFPWSEFTANMRTGTAA